MAAWPSRASDQIRTYTIPKETEAAAPAEAASPGAPDNMASEKVPMGDPSAGMHYQTPAGWKQLPPNSVRVASFEIPGANGQKADVAVTHFPGSVGSELSNVNRWRHELNLDPASEADITSEPVTVDADTGKLYDFSSASSRTVVADVPHNGESWFFKLRGDKDVVTGARPAFLDFLKSVKFTEAARAADLAGAPGSAPQPDGAVVPTPPTWRQKDPGPMILRAYALGDEAAPATVTVSSFPGVMGGLLANVNRWRRQLQLAEVSADSLPSVTQSIDAHGAPATMVDFTGTDAESAKPARMIAVMAPRGDQTWFYKLLGDPATVAREKDSFTKYVQTARDQ